MMQYDRTINVVKVHEFQCYGTMFVGDPCYLKDGIESDNLVERYAGLVKMVPGKYLVYQCIDRNGSVMRPYWTGVCIENQEPVLKLHSGVGYARKRQNLPVDSGTMFFADWRSLTGDFNSYDNKTRDKFGIIENGWCRKILTGEFTGIKSKELVSGTRFNYGFMSSTYHGDGSYNLLTSRKKEASVVALVRFA